MQIYSEREQVWKPGSLAKEDVGAYLRLKTVGSNPFEALMCQKSLKCIGTKVTSTGEAAERLSNLQLRSIGTVQREQTAKHDGVICVVLVL